MTKLADDTNPFKAAEIKADGEDLLKDFTGLCARCLSVVSPSLWCSAGRTVAHFTGLVSALVRGGR